MYESYYGLQERPFDLSPNPRFLFLSKKHNEALAHLRYGLGGHPGITVLVGEAGTGKTTIVRTALQAVNGSGAHAGVVHVSNPTLTRAEFYEYLAGAFQFGEAAATSKTRFLNELERALEDRPRQQVLSLIVDEAQSLPHELLEEIRLLTNVQSPSGRSLVVALVGQPELASRLNEDSLRQLKQRVALRCELTPLDLQETAAYIAARVRVAGGRAELLFTRDAVTAIHEHSHGIPRTISVICDNALVNGFATDLKPVGRDLVMEVCRDFQFATLRGGRGQPTGVPAPAPDPTSRPARLERANDRKSSDYRDSRSLFSGFVRKRFSFF
jgi:general secretion pathway protein A